MKNFIARIKGSWLYAWEHIKRFLKNPVKGFKEGRTGQTHPFRIFPEQTIV